MEWNVEQSDVSLIGNKGIYFELTILIEQRMNE